MAHSDTPVLDLTQIEEMKTMPGRQGASLLPEFMALFMRDEPKRIETLVRLAAEKRLSEIVAEAHTLAGSCAMLGAREMHLASLELQAAAKAGKSAELTERAAKVEETWSRLRLALAENRLLPV